jgi:hypothetical protein
VLSLSHHRSNRGFDLGKPHVLVGHASEYLAIQPLYREYPDADDYWDGNWVVSLIDFAVAGWLGSYTATLRTDEFSRFYAELLALSRTSKGSAIFSSMEDWLQIRVKRKSIEEIKADCILQARSHPLTRLELSLDLEQEDLARIISGIETVREMFPVISEP